MLDNLRNIEVEEYINQAKRINWKQLLSAAEEIMGFIQARKESKIPAPTQLDTSQIKISTQEPEIDLPEEEDDDLEWVEYAEPDNSAEYSLGEEEPVRTINIPKPQPRLKRERKLSRDPKPRLSLRRD